MPRISPRTVRQARALDRFLPSLLPVCRDIHSARNELRWLREHVLAKKQAQRLNLEHRVDLLSSLVKRRANGEPLQYILGSEYFGDLEIKCRQGVLIPRQETAASITYLVQRMRSSFFDKDDPMLRVIDLCTGTGCIPLLFHHEFYSKYRDTTTALQLVGVDISTTALRLACENMQLQRTLQEREHKMDSSRQTSLENIRMIEADVLTDRAICEIRQRLSLIEALKETYGNDRQPKFDILISNPPYISSKAFRTTTSRSVRTFEPTLALVPPTEAVGDQSLDGDTFYPDLLKVATQVDAKAVLFEVADLDQAQRVALLCARDGAWDFVEIWRDKPNDNMCKTTTCKAQGQLVEVRGSGNGRSVFAYRKTAMSWFRE